MNILFPVQRIGPRHSSRVGQQHILLKRTKAYQEQTRCPIWDDNAAIEGTTARSSQFRRVSIELFVRQSEQQSAQ
jgi:hypothetical protein